jgi:hypothetical protein
VDLPTPTESLNNKNKEKSPPLLSSISNAETFPTKQIGTNSNISSSVIPESMKLNCKIKK